MSQLHRFYVPDLCEQREGIRLSEEELHHALHVVRLRAGDSVRLFDGNGAYADGNVAAATKRDLELAIGGIHRDPPMASRLTLVQAWLNHAHAVETLIRRGTELGVDEFVFFRAEHSEKSPKAGEKWTRMAIESCKQCGRTHLPTFRTAKNIEEFIETRPEYLLVATQAVEPRPVGQILNGTGSLALIVGPEGDFTARELGVILEAGGHALSLGPITLRAEVAASTAIAIVQHYRGRLGPR
jgi:16S rRNA (uracil1498-N3)-methyltransferase